MTLSEAESDPRFQHFKFMNMIDLVQYIAKCDIFLADHPKDKDVTEFRDAAKLIKEVRTGQ